MFARLSLALAALAVSAVAKKPNILFILTDDQDSHMQSVEHMPLLQKHVINEGTTFAQHRCTIAICCPSRVNIWTGRAGHNTNVTDLFPPYGGYPKFVEEGLNDDWLPLWMQDAGYNTYYAGKLFNAHTLDNYNDPHVRGFNSSDFLLDPHTYEYWNAHMTRNGERPVSYKGHYSTDIIAEKAYAFLHEASTHEEPFMLTVAPIAPHSNVRIGLGSYDDYFADHPESAPRHAHLFNEYKIPRTSNFNPADQGGAVSWMRDLPLLNDTVVEYNDEYQRYRLRALQSVDEMVAGLVDMLETKGLLDNTYIVYTTDNGYHISQHRLHPGKECGYDTDTHVPLVIRGPGVPAGSVANVVTSHTDLAPTMLKIAGETRPEFDGLPIPLGGTVDDSHPGEHVNIEFWGNAIPEGIFGKYGNVADPQLGSRDLAPNNTYKGLRIVAEEYSLYYSVWCTGEKQYFDVKRDPGQIWNYFTNASPADDYSIAGRAFHDIVSRLDALMMVLKSCKQRECTHPWEVLHPKGDVHSLSDALSESYDAFYEDQPKVTFSSCQLGYIVGEEGPQDVNVYESGSKTLPPGLHKQQSFQYKGPWNVWV